METSVQNGAMAAGYALLFFLILRHPLRKHLRLMLLACAFATAYNIAYDSALHWRIITSLALFIRVLPPIEACWNSVGARRDCKVALTLLLAGIAARTFSPDQLSAGYLSTRALVTICVTLVCLMVAICNHFEMFEPRGFFSQHLVLQTLWMGLHTVFSVSGGWYNATWTRRGVARWVYVACSFGVILAYRRLLGKTPQAAEQIQQQKHEKY